MFKSHARNTFNRFTKKESYTWNTTNKELQSETCSLNGGDRRGFKRRCTMEKRPVTRDSNNNKKNNNNIIIIMGTNNNKVVAQCYVLVRTQTANQLTSTALGISRSWIYINCLKL
jgi:hypothetical protein